MIRGQTNRLRSQARPQPFDPRLFALALIVVCALLLSLGTRLATSVAAVQTPSPPRPQAARPQRRAPARTQPPNSQAAYWAKFKHERKEHFDNCVACHVTDTKPPMTFEHPEIEAFPDHPACIECHRKEFFRGPFLGSAPAICADCHAAAVPPPNKAKANLFEFPNPRRPEQFNDVFPHGTHQSSNAIEQFKKVKIEKPKQGEVFSCLACHQLDPEKDEKTGNAKSPGPVVKAGTYYDTYTDHANCFQCHWSKEKSGPEQGVYKDDCRSCHASVAHPTQPPPTGEKAARAWTTGPPVTPPVPGTTPTPAGCPTVVAAHVTAPPAGEWPARVSPMFEHASTSHIKTDEAGCVSCHTSLHKNKTLSLAQLRLKENQVQLAKCASCHNKLRGEGDDAKLFSEVKGHYDFYQQPQDKRAGMAFNCCYCHAPDLGTKQTVPCSHYTAFLNASKKLPPVIKKMISDAYLNSLPAGKCKDDLTNGMK
jgi:hypothetical protein